MNNPKMVGMILSTVGAAFLVSILRLAVPLLISIATKTPETPLTPPQASSYGSNNHGDTFIQGDTFIREGDTFIQGDTFIREGDTFIQGDTFIREGSNFFQENNTLIEGNTTNNTSIDNSIYYINKSYGLNQFELNAYSVLSNPTYTNLIAIEAAFNMSTTINNAVTITIEQEKSRENAPPHNTPRRPKPSLVVPSSRSSCVI